MEVEISDVLDCMNRDEKLTFMTAQLIAIKIEQDSKYSCEHIVLVFKGDKSIKIDVTTMPMADTSFRFKMIDNE